MLVYTIAMDYVRVGREGTDFTIQIVVLHLSSMLIAVVSGKLADQCGYTALFIAESILSALSLIYVMFYFKRLFRS